jgi:hypothetical protein
VNDLIAAPAGGPALAEAYTSLKIIGPAARLAESAQGGDWAVAQGLAGGVGVVADVAEFVVDPIASMAASVAGFLLDYMPPLPGMLDSIAGSPSAVAAKAQTWQNVSARVASSAEEHASAVSRSLDGWSGPAAEAYSAYASVYRSSLDALSGVCAGVGGMMSCASAVVGFVRSIVRDVVADLVGKLISWASQVAATVGVGATWVVPQAVTAIAIRVERVREWLSRLTRSIKALMETFERINNVLTEAVPALRRLATTLDDVPVAPLRGQVEAVTLLGALQSAMSVSNSLGRTYDGAVAATGGDR